ncbi:NADH:ubiquinone oxidoreductase, subunit 1/F420H2 oxidoreductase subunit H [Cucumis melo var. makuwa]|uniref:NADH:ubiquinone oxidoreductase, subunit 1/F420H2 oxidoreductase subunit H n=1 Tax=Cucumis melo var. makuwa TaxID=1194695 RepID=A0A5D3DY36_CUCMM|nr:hypothetical protein E6C27_scaffold61G00470 [Cucumis melo var. makuwa]TYK28249.1 NADH:ubiquinone oxidoreductase, subunit 1/F420H2 oxidoreductase subunit H [Cucumis melo var. makuwa]
MLISISQKQVSPFMLPQSAYQGLEREELEAELVGVKSRKPRERVWIRKGNRSDVLLTQPEKGLEGIAAWAHSPNGMRPSQFNETRNIKV